MKTALVGSPRLREPVGLVLVALVVVGVVTVVGWIS